MSVSISVCASVSVSLYLCACVLTSLCRFVSLSLFLCVCPCLYLWRFLSLSLDLTSLSLPRSLSFSLSFFQLMFCSEFRMLSRSSAMRWLRLVGSLKSWVSFAEYCLFYWALLQKRPIILRSLLIVATQHHLLSWYICAMSSWYLANISPDHLNTTDSITNSTCRWCHDLLSWYICWVRDIYELICWVRDVYNTKCIVFEWSGDMLAKYHDF